MQQRLLHRLFAKKTIRTKICCTTYKNICTYQKKVVPLQHEKVNKVSNICSSCMAYCTNSNIINLLCSGKFTNVNFTQSKLAKSLHMKIGAKVIKKLYTYKQILKKYEIQNEQTCSSPQNGGIWANN